MTQKAVLKWLAATVLILLVVSLIACPKPKPNGGTSVIEEDPFYPFDLGKGSAKPHQIVPITTLRFTDVAAQLGLVHTYQNGEQGKSVMVETTGGGAGWLDFDGDGLWDLFLNQAGDPTQPANASQPRDVLFRNLGADGFQQITPYTYIQEFGYSQGVAIGDYNEDGFDDIYVTNVGHNSLWLNLGDGTFQEVGDLAGVDDQRWSSSAAWADLDHDGDLDLYVCNYLQYDPFNPADCRSKNGERRICHPKDFDAWPDECYFNQGDGTFLAEASQRGLFGKGNKGLGVAIADFNNDGLTDIYIANDTTANFLFINQGNGEFLERAVLLGCSVDRYGRFQASMGLAVSDYDHNGFLDLYSTHFYEESNTLYRNLGPSGFEDATAKVALHQLTLPYLGFGVVMTDFDQNGFDDLFVTNGHIENFPNNPQHRMKNQLLSYDGHQWQETSRIAGKFFELKMVGRGVASADYDNDGDWDLAVVPQNDPIPLLKNESQRGHWLKFQFRGRESNRRGIGCRITIRQGDQVLVQQLCGGTSYASSHQPVLIFGLGESSNACDVDVRWPDGQLQTLEGLTVDTAHTLDQRDAS